MVDDGVFLLFFIQSFAMMGLRVVVIFYDVVNGKNAVTSWVLKGVMWTV